MRAHAARSLDSDPLSRSRQLILAAGRDGELDILPPPDEDVFQHLHAELTRLKLLGLLGRRLAEQLPEPLVPRWFREAVTDIVARGRRDSIRKQMLTWSLCWRLEQADIPALPLKGPFLAQRLHGDPGLRLSHDIDLLVDRDHVPDALRVLSEMGYHRREARRAPVLHHTLEGPDDVEVELHWRFAWYESDYARAVLARSIAGDEVRRPEPTDEAIMLLLIYARDGLLGLKTPVDLAAWWAAYFDSFDSRAADAILDRHRALRRPAAAAAAAVERAILVPSTAWLRPLELDRRARAALALADALAVGSDDDRDTRAKVVDWLLSDRVTSRELIGRTVLPQLPGSRTTEPLRRILYAVAFLRRAAPVAIGAYRAAA